MTPPQADGVLKIINPFRESTFHMGLKERIELYREIEELRKRPLITYVTSQRRNVSGAMASDVIPEIIDQLQAFTDKTDKIDLLLESSGGDALVAWRVMSLIREQYKEVSALIPYEAFSAATLLSMGCNEIFLGKYGCLGPIDPQIRIRKKDGTTDQFAYQDIVSYLGFVEKEAHLTEQSHTESAFKILCKQVEPSVLGHSRRASSLSVTMGEKLLQTHMTEAEEKMKASSIAKELNESFFSHGHALSRREAKDIGLKIAPSDPALEKLIWAVHEDVEKELKRREPFEPIGTFLSDPNAQIYLQSPPPLHIPPQISPQTAMQLMQNYFNQQLQARVPDVTVNLTWALVESPRHASAFQTQSKILLTRMADLRFTSTMVQIKGGWQKVALPNLPKNKAERKE